MNTGKSHHLLGTYEVVVVKLTTSASTIQPPFVFEVSSILTYCFLLEDDAEVARPSLAVTATTANRWLGRLTAGFVDRSPCNKQKDDTDCSPAKSVGGFLPQKLTNEIPLRIFLVIWVEYLFAIHKPDRFNARTEITRRVGSWKRFGSTQKYSQMTKTIGTSYLSEIRIVTFHNNSSEMW